VEDAYRTHFSYRRVYDELSIVTVAVMIGVWLLVVGGDVGAVVVLCVLLAMALDAWGREALWRRMPAAVRRELPKEPLEAKALPGAIAGYGDLYRALRRPSAPHKSV
jgi:hypothetical protein